MVTKSLVHKHTKCPSRHLKKKTSQKHSLDNIIVLIDFVDATHDGTIEQENKKIPKEREDNTSKTITLKLSPLHYGRCKEKY